MLVVSSLVADTYIRGDYTPWPKRNAAPSWALAYEGSGMDFVVIDVETANTQRSSVCQVGLAAFSGGRVQKRLNILINPECGFSSFNIGVHGIYPKHVVGAPTWGEVYPEFQAWVTDRIVASHTYFDREAIRQACLRSSLSMFSYLRWIDTCEVSRIAWPNLLNHKLSTVAKYFDIKYDAHNAAEDARAAGEILVLSLSASRVAYAQVLKGTTGRESTSDDLVGSSSSFAKSMSRCWTDDVSEIEK